MVQPPRASEKGYDAINRTQDVISRDNVSVKVAARKLVEAAEILSGDSRAIQLRYLQTLTEIAGDNSSTIVFPLEITDRLKKVLE